MNENTIQSKLKTLLSETSSKLILKKGYTVLIR